MTVRLTLLFAVLLPTAVFAQSPMEIAKKSAAIYRSETLKKDYAGFEKASTPDFVYIDLKGRKADKKSALQGMKAFYGTLTISKLTVTADSAKKAEGGVVYVQETHLTGLTTMGGPKPSKFSSHSRDEVLLVKVGGIWKVKRVKNLSSDDRMNGKPMQGM